MEINSPEHVQDYLTHLPTRFNHYFGKHLNLTMQFAEVVIKSCR